MGEMVWREGATGEEAGHPEALRWEPARRQRSQWREVGLVGRGEGVEEGEASSDPRPPSLASVVTVVRAVAQWRRGEKGPGFRMG